VKVPGVIGATQVAAGSEHSLVLDVSGAVTSFGSGYDGQLGFTATTSGPQVVHGLPVAIGIVAGGIRSGAIRATARLDGWGSNQYGNLGMAPDNGPHPLPQRIQQRPGTDFVGLRSVSAGCDTTIALRADGTAYTFGYNDVGQIGTSVLNPIVSTPTPITTLPSLRAVAMGCVSGYAIAGNGSVYSWGNNTHGQLGRSSAPLHTDRNAPGLMTLPRPARAIAAGHNSVLVLLDDGSVMEFGKDGQDGLDYPYGRQRAFVAPVARVFAGERSFTALLVNGRVVTWGQNNAGQLGVCGVATNPPQIVTSSTSLSQFTLVASGAYHSLGIVSGHRAVAGLGLDLINWQWGVSWGWNGANQLDRNLAVFSDKVCNPDYTYGFPLLQTDGVVAVSAGWDHTLVLTGAGTVLGFGSTEFGQTGVNSNNNISSAAANPYSAISAGYQFSMALAP
jgi:alpha-tubulin suppressor-like RCC1 family protein